MIAVIDTGYLIDRQIPIQNITQGYVTDSVMNELKTRGSREYLNFLSFMIEVRNPSDEYVMRVKKSLKNRINNLSDTDVDVVALTLEVKDEVSSMWIGPENPIPIDVCCLTHDNGIKNALAWYDSYEEVDFSTRTYKLRCYGCRSLYSEDMDFCKRCGHSTLTRVSVIETNGEEKVLLKKNYRHKSRILRNEKGIELRSADQREYLQYQKNSKKSG